MRLFTFLSLLFFIQPAVADWRNFHPPLVKAEALVKGEKYFSNCEHLMTILDKKEGESTEDKFVALTSTPSQMLQLLRDYGLILNENFSLALAATILPKGRPSSIGTYFTELLKIDRMTPESFSEFIWTVFDHFVDRKANSPSSSKGQVAHLRTKNLVEAIKKSPNRRMFEEILFSLVRRHMVAQIVNNNAGEFRRFDNGRGVGTNNGLSVYFMNRKYVAQVEKRSPLDETYPVQVTQYDLPKETQYFTQHHSEYEPLPITFVGEEPVGTEGHTFNFFPEDEPSASPTVIPGLKQVTQTMHSFDFNSGKLDNSDTASISIAEACKTETCSLSPVQVAYVGHVDFLELETLNASLSASLKTDRDQEISQLDKAARDVSDDPSSYVKQMKLKMILAQFVGKVTGALDSQRNAAQTLIQATDSVVSHYKMLANKPYETTPKSDEDIAKNGMLLHKITTDLKSLENIKINTVGLSRRIDKTQATVDLATTLLQALPSSPAGWQEAAAEIILRLDELR